METKALYKIILADDHIVLRDALAALINTFDECRVLTVAADGEELIQELGKGFKPDIIILDLNMPKMDGYAAAAWLKKNRPEIKIVVLTMYDSEVALIRLLQMGVRGFLKKDINPNDLKAALISIAENGYYYSSALTGKLAAFFYKNEEGSSQFEKALLNEKEMAFLKLSATDLTYKEIAGELGMTARAIDGYRDSLFEKLDVKSRVGLAIYAVKNGIVIF
jgi:two-component system invasion response regulator UvrY